jgi:hypothetical protein
MEGLSIITDETTRKITSMRPKGVSSRPPRRRILGQQRLADGCRRSPSSKRSHLMYNPEIDADPSAHSRA